MSEQQGDPSPIQIGILFHFGLFNSAEIFRVKEAIGPRFEIIQSTDDFTVAQRDDGKRYYIEIKEDAGRILLSPLVKIPEKKDGIETGETMEAVSDDVEMYYLTGARPPLIYGYDPGTDIASIDGSKFTGDFFRHFAKQIEPEGVCVLVRNTEGVCHTEQINLPRLQQIELAAAEFLREPGNEAARIRLDAALIRPSNTLERPAPTPEDEAFAAKAADFRMKGV